MKRWRTRQSLVAVDWGSRSLRAVQLAATERHPRVVHWLNVETPPLAPDVAADTKPNVDTIRRPIPAGLDQFQTRRTGLVISSPDMGYCLLTVPEAIWAQGPEAVADSLRWEVGQQLNRGSEEAEVGAWPLPSPLRSGANAVAVAADRGQIGSAVRELNSQRLDCAFVEAAGPAIVRSCHAVSQCKPGEIWGVADLGHRKNWLYVAVDETIVFARQIPGNGATWTSLIAQELRTTPALAEDHKCRSGIGSDERSSRSILGTSTALNDAAMPGVLLAILRTSLHEMTADIERAFRFVMEQYPQRQVGSLILTGGGVRMPGLPSWIAGQIGIRAALAEPAGAVALDDTHPLTRPDLYSVMAGCIGLAMGDLSE